MPTYMRVRSSESAAAQSSVLIASSSGKLPVLDELGNTLLVENIGGGNAPSAPLKVLGEDGSHATAYSVPWLNSIEPVPLTPTDQVTTVAGSSRGSERGGA